MTNQTDIIQRVAYLYGLDAAKKQADATKLAGVLGIHASEVEGSDDKILLALCGTILIRHLDHYNQALVFQDIHDLLATRPMLAVALLSCIDDAMVSPSWAPWSMSTEALEQWLHADKIIDQHMKSISLVAGIGVSIRGIYENYLAHRLPPLMIVGIVFWILRQCTQVEEEKMRHELAMRTPTSRSIPSA